MIAAIRTVPGFNREGVADGYDRRTVPHVQRSTLLLPLLWLGSRLYYGHPSVWQSILHHLLCNQEINDMKGIYKKVFKRSLGSIHGLGRHRQLV